MTTHVAFLRAVNLGRRTAPAGRLVAVAEECGHTDVWTYANSGNVIFEATGPVAAIESELEQAFEAALGFEATTFVRTRSELAEALAPPPFPVQDGDTYFITFLKDRLDRSQAAALKALSNDFDTLVLVGPDVHWRMRGKSTDTKLKTRDWDSTVGRRRSTSRNTHMLGRLLAKMDERG